MIQKLRYFATPVRASVRFLRITINNTKVDPKLRRIYMCIDGKIIDKSCIGHEYVCIYEVGCRMIVHLKS